VTLSGTGKLGLRIGVVVCLAFIYVPLLVIGLYAFNKSRTLSWPPPGLTLDWFDKAFHNTGARDAFTYSLKVAAAATTVALVLGTLAAMAVSRYRFFGRDTISLLLVLPIALPGIVSGIALNATFTQTLDVTLGFTTLITAHATFCIVVIYNNVSARLRRMSGSIEEASADLGASPWQTFRYVTLPTMRTALVAGGLLAFALSFDEIIVTTFTTGEDQTLPIWIFANLSRPNQLPIVNVVAVLVILLSIIPVYLAHRLTREEGGAVGRAAGRAVEAEATAVP
jgi:putative spermidine/putrescine transport system permease protein